MKSIDISIKQAHEMVALLRDSLPFIRGVNFHIRSGEKTDNQERFYISLFADLEEASPLSSATYGIHGSGYTDEGMGKIIARFRSDYLRALEVMVNKQIGDNTINRLLQEYEDKNLDLIDGPTVSALAKEVA
jgi:hypothetical protein